MGRQLGDDQLALTTLKTLTARNPTPEQNIMCQSVRAIGKGKPL